MGGVEKNLAAANADAQAIAAPFHLFIFIFFFNLGRVKIKTASILLANIWSIFMYVNISSFQLHL